MEIRQLSVDYREEEDRILIRINTNQGEEVRFWITRRMLTNLWPTLKRVAADHALRHGHWLGDHIVPVGSMDDPTKTLLHDFQRAQSLQGADFQTPFDNLAATLPLGEQPVLVTEVKLTPLDNGQLQILLAEQLPGGASPRSCQLDLSAHLTQGLLHLLEQTLLRSNWSIVPLPPSHNTERDVAEPAEAGRPKYLN